MGGTGSHADILKTKGNGVPAVNAGSVATGFKNGGGQAITDVEFVEDDTHNIAIFAATTDNFVVLADMRATAAWNGVGMPPAIPSRQIDLHSLSSSDVDDKYKNNEESSSGHGRGQVRSIVWAPGTNKVLVNSGLTKELHLITLAADGGIEGATLTRTIAGADSKYMVFVDNHDVRAKTREMDAKIAALNATVAKAEVSVSDSSSDDVDAKTMAVGGLVLGALGFLLGAASFFIMLSRDACGSKKTVAREISFGKDRCQGRCVALRLAQSRRIALTATCCRTTCPNRFEDGRTRRLVYAQQKGCAILTSAQG